MTTSKVAAALDWLVGACQAGVTPVGGSTVPVFISDGPLITEDPAVFPQRLMIGGDVLAPGEAVAEAEQEFAAINQARSRYETFHLVCSAEDWSGDTTMKTRRDNVYALVAQVELLIRGVNNNPGDTTMGGAVMYSQISGPMQLHQTQDPNGASAVLIFRISAKARLTTP